MSKADVFLFQVEKFREGEPNVLAVIVPPQLSNDFDALHKKLENSALNERTYLPKWGKIQRLLHIEGTKGIEVFSDDIHPFMFSDWANIILNQLNQHMDDEENLSSKVEDELVFFIGEFTLLRDGSI